MYFIHNTGGGKEGKKDRRSTHTEKNEWEKRGKNRISTYSDCNTVTPLHSPYDLKVGGRGLIRALDCQRRRALPKLTRARTGQTAV